MMSKRISLRLALTLGCFALARLSLGADTTPLEPPEGSHPVLGSTTKGPYYNDSENELRARKLMRGVANVTLCVAEIPNQAFQEAYRTSPVTGAVVGAGKGVYKGLKRFCIGFWEIATFYLPLKNNYQPYIEPEVVFMEYTH